MYRTVFIIITGLLFSCSVEKGFVEKPVIFDERRVALTKEYLKVRYGLDRDSITIDPKMIVLHHTVIPTFKKTFEAFNSPT